MKTLTAIINIVAALCMVACENTHYLAESVKKNGTYNRVQEDSFGIGYKYFSQRSDGSSRSSDSEAGFLAAMQAAAALGVSVTSYLTAKAEQLTSQLATAEAGTTERARIAAELAATQAQLKEAVALEKIAKAPVQ